MPKVLVTFVRYIEEFNLRLGKILNWAIFALIGILLFESVARYGFNSPTVWSIELSAYILGFYFLIGGGWVLLHGGHVRMDAIYSRWSAKKRAVVDLATFSLFAVYIVVYVWGGIQNALFSLRFGQTSVSIWGPPLAPIKIIMTVGATILLLQGIASFIRDLSIARGKPIK